jgi:arylsulfatase A-like enzyme
MAGLGFGLAIGIVHLAIGIGLIMAMKMPPMTWFAAKTILIELPLAGLVGVLLCPVFLSRRGAWIHPIAMAVLWIVAERFVAVDPQKIVMWLPPALVALGLYGAFFWLTRKRRWINAVVGVVVPVILLSIPVIRLQTKGGYGASVSAGDATAPSGAPDVVFIVMDTVRAQSVSAYGYERETTPNLDAFAQGGVLFEQATAPSTWSLPAHSSLFTGTLPSIHDGHGETRWLDDRLPTLAETMSGAGWETRCFTANPFISPSFGLTRGFEWSDQAWITGAGGRGFAFIYRFIDALGVTARDKGGAQVVDNIDKWMDSRPADAPPAFVFVNFLEAHFPFHQLPAEYRNAYTDMPLRKLRSIGQIAFGTQLGRQLTDDELDRIQGPITDLYDGGVLYTDHLVGRVIDAWERRGTLDDTVFVIVADHGELVGEHGAFDHVTQVYEECLRVPFVIRYPERIPAGSRVPEPINTLGIFATITDLAGAPTPDTVQVGSLMPALDGKPAGLPVISERFEEILLSARFGPGEANGVGPLVSPRGRYRTYREGNFKLAKHYENGDFSTYLFDLEADPGETTDIAGSALHMADRQRLEEELAAWEAYLNLPTLDAPVDSTGRPDSEGGPAGMDEAAKAQLKALGYIE